MPDLEKLTLVQLEALLKEHQAKRPIQTWALGFAPSLEELKAWEAKLQPWADTKDRILYHLDLKRQRGTVGRFVPAEEIPQAEKDRIEASLAQNRLETDPLPYVLVKPNPRKKAGVLKEVADANSPGKAGAPAANPPAPAPVQLTPRRSMDHHRARLQRLSDEEAECAAAYQAGDRAAYMHIQKLRQKIRNLRHGLGLEPCPFIPLPRLATGPKPKRKAFHPL
ncbi:MAG TPA: hypothetical protein VJ623_05470, partial [Holophagaceae bacterium]|nr:hypothetical protein [Holophagaceae bacterium]